MVGRCFSIFSSNHYWSIGGNTGGRCPPSRIARCLMLFVENDLGAWLSNINFWWRKYIKVMAKPSKGDLTQFFMRFRMFSMMDPSATPWVSEK